MKITVNELTRLAGFFPEATEISLFRNVSGTPDGSEDGSLEEKGVLTGGELSPQAREIFSVVAGAGRCSRMVMRDGLMVVEKYTYRLGDSLVVAENEQGELKFSAPSNLNRVLKGISQFTGLSDLKTSALEVLLSLEELLCYLGCCDLTRRDTLRAAAGDKELDGRFTLEELEEELKNPLETGLLRLTMANYGWSLPEGAEVKNLLEGLLVRSMLEYGEGKYSLQDEYYLFAARFLIPQLVAVLEAFDTQPDGSTLMGQALVISAGLRDSACLIPGDEGVEFSTLSAGQIITLCESFMNCPELG